MEECKKCSEMPMKKPFKCDLPQAVQILNPSEVVIFHRIDVPASLGDDETNPPVQGEYKNVLLVYEANNHAYMYNSDGIYTRITGVQSFDELSGRPRYAGEIMTSATDIPDIGDMRNDIDNIEQGLVQEISDRELSDAALSDDITDEVNARINADGILDGKIALKANSADLATVAFTGDYDDLSDTPTNVSTFANDAGYQNSTQVGDAITTATTPISNAINKSVISDVALDNTPSASTVTINKTTQNISSGTTSAGTIVLPVASNLQAGVINAATYATIQDNASYINAILNGAVAISGLPANPTQVELTTAWTTATGINNVINGAKINDSDNSKVWTYYTNTLTWYAATNTAQVTVNPFTNSAAGIIKGSTAAGQVFAESDGTGSVNGWDALNNTVSGKADSSSLASVATSGSYNDLLNKPTIGNATITLQQNGTALDTFTTNANSNKNINLPIPVITMQTTDPGEGVPLAANNFLAIYEA